MYHSFLIHSSADGHLCCFHVLAIINSVAMNIGVHLSLSDLVSSLCMPSCYIVSVFAIPRTPACQASLSSLTPRVCANSCPLSWWYCLTISSSPAPFSFYVQSFPASGSFAMSWLFASDGQSIGDSASASASASNEHSELISFRIDWFDLLAVQGTLKNLLKQHSSKASIL